MTNLTVAEIETTYLVPLNRTDGYADVRAYWVPIALRDAVLAAYRAAGVPVRLRYRGPRTVAVGRPMTYAGHNYRRSYQNAMQTCLLADATHFTVYAR